MTERSQHKRRPAPKSKPAPRPGQPGGVRDLNRQAKVKALQDAALLLFLQNGVEGVSVDDITQAAGVAKGSFYRYFEDQAALVESLVAPVRTLMLDAMSEVDQVLETAKERTLQFDAYKKIGSVLATLLMEHPGTVKLYLQECRAPAVGARKPLVELSEKIAKSAITMTVRAQKLGIFKPFPPAVSALTVVGASERLILGVLQEEEALGNPLEIPNALVKLIFDGIGA
jgi:AcrR family transcriptional regulator